METNKLIDRLRELSKIGIVNYKHDTPVLIEAADRINDLEERIAIMQESMEALKKRMKEQEPRVMTLEEVREMSWDYCYLEEEVINDKILQIYSGKHRIKCITWPSIASCALSFGYEAYGKKWRCWTARPTEEQREAVKWEA